MTAVRDIIRVHLVAGGFDGLVQSDAECGCLADDLSPCDHSAMDCRPGYRGVSADDPSDWAIFSSKEAAEASKVAAGQEGGAP